MAWQFSEERISVARKLTLNGGSFAVGGVVVFGFQNDDFLFGQIT